MMKKNLHLISYRLLITIAFLCFFSKGIKAEDTSPDTWENLASAPANWSTSPYSTEISISSAAELAWVAKMVNNNEDTGNSGKKGFEGVKITLTKELDLTGHNWIPIGKTKNYPFKGTFDGKNSLIQNMNISTEFAAGLFGHAKNAKIENVNLEQCSIEKKHNTNDAGSSDIYAGCVVGYSQLSEINNCSAKGSLTYLKAQGGYMGGITGYNFGGSIDGCVFEGSLKSTAGDFPNTSSTFIGGIAGNNKSNQTDIGTIKNSQTHNTTIVSEYGHAGGITTINEGYIKDCSSEGTITITTAATNYGIGGIASCTSSGTTTEYSIEGCTSSCNIEVKYKISSSNKSTDINTYSKVGGIVGWHDLKIKPIFKCTSSGTISMELITDTPQADLNGNSCYAGGIAGYSQSNIIDCESSADIQATASFTKTSVYAGGIAGYISKPVTNSIASGSLTTNGYYNYSGGITGYSFATITNCQGSASIAATGTNCYVGGIAGRNYENVKNCFSTAHITSEGGSNYTGGIAGYNNISSPYYTGNIQDCYTTGNITSANDGKKQIGGIAGYNKSSILNCYATGKIEATNSSTQSYVGGIAGTNYASIEKCVALNTAGISNSTANIGRINGYIKTGTATTSNNYAHSEIPGEWDTSNTNLNGSDWDETNYPFASSDAWSFTDNQLPKLKKINADGISYSDMVANQPDIPLINLQYFTITINSLVNGTLTVSTADGTSYSSGKKVQGGTELTITATPEDTYQLDGITVNDQPFTSGTTLIVSEDITISATFIKLHTVTIDNPEHGTITVVDQASKTINTNDQVPEGTILTITATPEDTYQLDELTVNCTSFASGTTWTVSEDITISATFSKTSKPDPKPEPDPTPVPPIYHTVTLPQVEGATTDPVAGQYEVEAWSSFRFYLTLDKEYDQSSPIVTTDRGETITPRSSDGAYIIKYVRQPIAISIDGIVRNPDPVANETISTNETTVRAEGAYLHLHTSHLETVFIYTFNGTLLHKYDNLSGDKSLWLPQGNYIVIAGNKSFKIQIQK